MKILLLNAGTSWGGIESQGLVLANALRKKRHSVIVGCSSDGHVKVNAEKQGFSMAEIKISNSLDIGGIFKIIRVAIREKIDVIIVTLGKEYWPAVIAARLSGRKLIVVRHLLYDINKHTAWLITRYAAKIIAVSNAVKEVMVNCGIPSGKVEVVYNGIELNKFSCDVASCESIRTELGIPKNTIVIGTAGKLHPHKGCFELVRAMSRVIIQYPDTLLLFVGDGYCRPQLEKEINKYSLQNKVLITGYRNDMERMFTLIDMFVLASQSNEAFGMVLLEAMAMGKPVIGTNVGGIPEIIQHEVNGLLIPPGDTSALTDAITRYIRNPDFSNKMAQAGRHTVESKFSENILGEQYDKILQKIHPLPN